MLRTRLFDALRVMAQRQKKLSLDHRVADGMHAAQCIQAVRELLQNPALLLVH